jgi:hypothetical protein
MVSLGIVMLERGDLVILIRETLFALSEVKTNLCLFQKRVGRFFKYNFLFNQKPTVSPPTPLSKGATPN